MAGKHVASLAAQLQQELVQRSAGGGAGFFTSPVSLYVALALALNGTGPDSTCQQQLLQLLHPAPVVSSAQGDVESLSAQLSELLAALAAQPGDGGCELIVANGVWTHQLEVLPGYAADMARLFKAEVAAVASADPINAWAAKQTRGLITVAVPPGSRFDLVLTNALYFKGLWQHAFDKDVTASQPFALADGRQVQVPMMQRLFKPEHAADGSRPVMYAATDSYSAVKLPYKGCSISAIAVLPSQELAANGIAAAAAQLDLQQLLEPSTYRRVPMQGLQLALPRFKASTQCVSLKQELMRLGAASAFEAGAADFSRLSSTPLFIADVLQSVCVIVDEEGTEAAAVTAVVMLRSLTAVREPVSIRFDRPFIFLLADEASGAPLFVGSVHDPSASA